MSEIPDRAARLEALDGLWLLCPNVRTEDTERLARMSELYLRATAALPTWAFRAGVSALVRTWRWPNPPQPVEIIEHGRKAIAARRKAEARQLREAEQQAALESWKGIDRGEHDRKLLDTVRGNPLLRTVAADVVGSLRERDARIAEREALPSGERKRLPEEAA